MTDDEPMVTLQIRLPRDLMRRIDTHRLGLLMRPTRSQMIRFLAESAMSIIEEAKQDESQGQGTRRE